MRKVIPVIFIVLLVACKQKQVSVDPKIVDRITFVYNLKQLVNDNYWQTFSDTTYDLPLIYFTDTSSFIANPTKKFLQTFKADLVFKNKQLAIYKTNNRVDSLPFHMETGLTLGDPTDAYNYHSPFMKCSSYEEVFKTIPSVQSTEEWTTMIMHEYFHGFQYKHSSYISYYEQNIVQIQPDSLAAMYSHYKWFKKSIDKENQILLQAITEKDSVQTMRLVDSFFIARSQRRALVAKQLQLNLAPYEKCYETMEGTARYIEYALYSNFSSRPSDEALLKSDTCFKSFSKFKNYDIAQDKWLYLTEKTTYFYAIGFNMARLLDKLHVEYKSKLFKNGQLSLEDILLDKLNNVRH